MPHPDRIDGATAWQNLLRSASSRWSDGHDPGDQQTAHARISRGLAIPRMEPKFRLRPDDVYFCIGSCFARNIEEHLIYRDLAVISRSVPFGDRDGRPNGWVNKYTAASILNELRWSLDGEPFPEESLVEDSAGWRDLHLNQRTPAAPRDDVLARREHVRAYFARARDATVVILTLGLVETWIDRHAGVALNAAPSVWMTRRFPGRFELAVTDYTENMRMLHEIIEVVNRRAQPDVRIVISVSPVPMSETFTGRDVMIANAYSKSTLRAAADDTVRAFGNVDYYPSYEAITGSSRTLAFNGGDDLHVLDSAVRAIADDFVRTYGAGGDARYPEFVELDYLAANPDVHDAVLAQQFASGYAHWLAHGHAEGRPLRAEHRSLRLQRTVGP